jgi:GTP pyrophosphokinase
VVLITKAYEFARRAHENHTRLSGEPYFYHLSETAKNIAWLGMSATTIAAGILHDVLEDVSISPEKLKEEFGTEILFLVEGVTKLGKLKYRGTDRYNESLRKLFVAMSQDIRVLIIKLADRLHNMKTLSHVPADKQKRIAEETLEIYAPIAYRLGIRKLNRELEDLAFPYVYPKEYEEIKKTLKVKRDENQQNLEKFLKSIKKALAKDGVISVRTEYRIKGLFSLYKKIQLKKDVEKIHDILALRVFVSDIPECYKALGIIHGSWRPLPGKIKDYIAFPKPNGYKALHTTVFTGDGSIVEVQIKTLQMHLESEYGIASHVSYKEGRISGLSSDMLWVRNLLPKKNLSKDYATISSDVPTWIKELVEYQNQTKDDGTFREDIRSDFFGHRIFVFTPVGDVIDLPIGSCPIDFAYSIHSEIGDHTFGAKVNGKLVSLNQQLKNGDIVEIITKPKSKPSTKWLEYTKTTAAKKHVRSAIQQEGRKVR